LEIVRYNIFGGSFADFRASLSATPGQFKTGLQTGSSDWAEAAKSRGSCIFAN
jgi:hypothetical protein